MHAAHKVRGNPTDSLKLRRISLLKAVLQAFRTRIEEELQPLGVTAAQMRMLWAVADSPGVSGAMLARICAVTPQTGQAIMARLEENGWVRRRTKSGNERVLVAELTPAGRRLLDRARKVAEALDKKTWHGLNERELHAVDAVLGSALDVLSH